MNTEIRAYQEIAGMPDRPSLPVLIEASYDLADDELSAVLCLKGNNAHSLQLAIIHEKRHGLRPSQYDICGDESCDLLQVRSGEGLIVLARSCLDEIIACAFFQVNLGLYESIASVLLHVSVNNLEILRAPDPDETILVPAVKVEAAQ